MEIEKSKTCKVCEKLPAQYKCPKCSIDYCSLSCFKSSRHVKCTEKFYQEQIRESLKSEKVSELSDERGKMIKILEKLNNLDLYNESESDEFDIDSAELDNLNVEDLEALLGEKHLAKVNELIENGVSSDWLNLANISVSKDDTPWFMRYKPSSVILNEDLPDFVPIHNDPIPNIKSLTKKNPSDFLWNNLLEISVIYSFIHFQFSLTELKDSQVIETEVQPIFLELCSSLMQHNSPFGSAIDALEVAKSNIFFNSTVHNLSVILNGVVNLLSNSKMLTIMLSDILFWFPSSSSNISTEAFLARKKLIFIASWLNSEITESKGSVNEILKTLTNIVEQFE